MDKYKRAYIDNIKSRKFKGWTFAIIVSVVIIFLWLFGVPELWPLKNKIFVTAIGAFIVYGMGIREILEAKKELKKELKDE
jgi:hypothetical protein